MKKILASLLLVMFLSANYGIAAEATNDSTEHLMQSKKISKETPTDLVIKTPVLTTVLEYNLIEVTFAEDFTSKKAEVGDKIEFLLKEGLTTREGTVLLPPSSKLSATVIGIQKPKSFNRSGKITLQFNEIVTPEGKTFPLKAKLYKKDFLSRGKLNAMGKGLGTTLGCAGVGIGAGCGIGAAVGAVCIGGFAIGLPVGIGVGAIAGLCTPGLHYKAKAGDKLMIQLTDNIQITQ